MATTTLLDISTLIERETITIDEARYELFSPDELSVLDSHRLTLWARRIEALDGAGDEEGAAELSDLIDKAVRTAIVALPEDVFAKLSGTQKRAIVDVFTGLLLRNRLKAAGAMAAAMGSLSIGATFSPDSSASMAEPPARGWRRFLPRWCART